jgi:antitoxin Phd
MDTAYPQLYVPTRPYWTSCDCRNASATNRYPVFGDGSVNCLTHFQKVFRMPERGRQGPAIFKTRDVRTAFHSALRREQRDTLRRRLREDSAVHFSASSSSPNRLDGIGCGSLERHAVLQTHRNRDREIVHQRAEGRAFLLHVDKDFGQSAVLVLAGPQIDLVAADRVLLRVPLAAVRQPRRSPRWTTRSTIRSATSGARWAGDRGNMTAARSPASSSSPKRPDANGKMYIYCESRYISVEQLEGDMAEPDRIWQIKDARANFSTLVDKAMSDGPQIVTRNGKKAVVVVSIEEWTRLERRDGDLVEFFANSLLREEGFQIERQRDYPRDIEF